ncbi:hypothetical protein BASA60_002542 [Batrachochytrium salamandrivorans]|nr:hypothetical protein BASA60_002542 [Batrachochytrium salamandrivorans]
MSLVVKIEETATYTFTVEYDPFLVFVSYWTAVLGAYTGIQILNELMGVYQTYIAINVTSLLENPPRIENRALQSIYIYFKINAKIILSILMIAMAIGGCGIWGMHFLGMHALRLYIVPKNVTSTLPIFDPYTEEIDNHYFLIIPLYYEGWTTVASLLIAVVAVFTGMLISAYGAGMIHVRSDNHKMATILKNHVLRTGLNTQSKLESTGKKEDDPKRVATTRIMSSIQMASQVAVSRRVDEIGTPVEGRPSNVVNPTIPNAAATDGPDEYININLTNFFQLSFSRQAYFMLGCTITGLGAAAMHYCGVASIRIPGVKIVHNPLIVVLAVMIGLVVATAGLWILFFLRGTLPRLMSPLVIGAAVFALHYVGMYGTKMTLVEDPMTIDYKAFLSNNPTAIGGLLIETIRAQVNFSLELVILAVGFHLLQKH